MIAHTFIHDFINCTYDCNCNLKLKLRFWCMSVTCVSLPKVVAELN